MTIIPEVGLLSLPAGYLDYKAIVVDRTRILKAVATAILIENLISNNNISYFTIIWLILIVN